MIDTKFLKNQRILITGGTGSFGIALINYLLNTKHLPSKIVVFSRDELKQYQMIEKYQNHKNFNILRFFLGDVRDKDRIKLALKDVDILIHAAALKQVPAAEYNPFEFIKTNIFGAQNLIEACLDSSVKKVIALSTDKASSPVNLYGATKLCSDKLFTLAQNVIGKKKITFSVVRYGNVFGSRGSVVPKFLRLGKNDYFPVTDKHMTRFNLTLKQSVEYVLKFLKLQKGGEIFVPKLSSFKIVDLCEAINKQKKIKYVGLRPGEKLHEELISQYDSNETVDCENYYIILPHDYHDTNFNYNKKKLKRVKKNFVYSSNINNQFLSIKDLKKLISKNEII